MPRFNDFDLTKWRELTDIDTNSLWIIDKRDNTGAHSGSYHGNFVPQIVNQLLKRYTKQGDWVLDPFMGSGTTLIEAGRLQRNAIGIELNGAVAAEAEARMASEPADTSRAVYAGDSTAINIDNILREQQINTVQFVVFHPPYWDIIRFSDDKKDLSNSQSIEEFLTQFGQVIDNATSKLEPGRYCAVVIGDKYMNGQVVPLGFYCMNLFMERGFIQKAIIVKNFGETRGKGVQTGIWRYRALASDYMIFKHEYIFVFKKPK